MTGNGRNVSKSKGRWARRSGAGVSLNGFELVCTRQGGGGASRYADQGIVPMDPPSCQHMPTYRKVSKTRLRQGPFTKRNLRRRRSRQASSIKKQKNGIDFDFVIKNAQVKTQLMSRDIRAKSPSALCCFSRNLAPSIRQNAPLEVSAGAWAHARGSTPLMRCRLASKCRYPRQSSEVGWAKCDECAQRGCIHGKPQRYWAVSIVYRIDLVNLRFHRDLVLPVALGAPCCEELVAVGSR